jgi:phosphate transport system protein
MTDHTVKSYDVELEVVSAKIAEMGGTAERMLADALESLVSFNVTLARNVVDIDPRLDELQRELEEHVVMMIARRQPMALDLRVLVGAIHIAGDLERIGDLAKNISKRVLKIASNAHQTRAIVGLKHIGRLATVQLKDVLDAFAQRDVERARAVWLRDAEIDALEDSVFRDLLTFMMEDPRNISFCTHLLFCSKNLERVGDHATNIAETIHFIYTGISMPIDRPRGNYET